jgi:hypothetical protein
MELHLHFFILLLVIVLKHMLELEYTINTLTNSSFTICICSFVLQNDVTFSRGHLISETLIFYLRDCI